MKYYKVLYEAGVFLDNFHYAKDEIVAYDPADYPDHDGQVKEPLWGQLVDERGEPVATPAPNAKALKEVSDASSRRTAAQALADNAFRETNGAQDAKAHAANTAPNAGTAHQVAVSQVLNQAGTEVLESQASEAQSQLDADTTPEAPVTKTKGQSLAEALSLLEHDNDAHWTQSGQPKLDVLKEILGHDVKRADIDPGFVRVKKA